ncbi:WD-40 repeat-containing protein [Phreatobacter oligotrophus]|uniref:WD-40 repeat-containing protein n=2 Tax=Phreatobacter oligotrophus TaxID=1122261 RepID=A0A2T4YY03_9HYPH|nr:WD-40 repeat-containing protein [Phreatobacter oligotrophus]
MSGMLSFPRFRRLSTSVAMALAAAALALAAPAAAQEMRGHGGPVRALAVAPDGRLALSGSFDSSAILWDIEQGLAVTVLRGHDSSVNAVAALPDGRFATAGEDGRILLWRIGRAEPEARPVTHEAPVAALALSPDGQRLASASWDGTVRLAPLSGGAARVATTQRGPLNAVGFAPDGRSIVTGGHDGALRFVPLDGGTDRVVELGLPVNALAVAADGEIAAGLADGRVVVLSGTGQQRGEIRAAETPIVAVGLSPDGKRIAAAGIRGSVAIIDRATLAVERVLVGPGLPVWSLAFRPGTEELLTGGGDRLVRRWLASTGEHIGAVIMAKPSEALARLADHPGAEVFRACAACHTLDPDGGNRAGPTLHGVIGRRIGTAPGYDYSPALRGMDIVWTKETIARLFEIGPMAYTPGTKMPEQRVTDPEDLKDLVDFIAKATGAE